MSGNASFCLECSDRPTCKAICKKLAKELRKVTKGKQKWETLVDPSIIEKYEYKSKERGFRVKPKIYDENYELTP